ncbi:patatin-like phospholipase family protein [Nannocystis sp. SCPEA4]|uniref:patatin-like phospholipase family protein n=1 Tax=Nannocystis sp. SCPEA4 TaxID=2996787 RepID=UPI00226F665F|nr:patatin-like phospholipase family protein [Nannocystis sp. SCPEA4]MCY1061287.1 patatin-like phospholipase family protein [Nannocystis sp. SCPEA4]
MEHASNRDWLAAEPFTLALSAGFFGFFAHTGVLQALEEAGLAPRRIVGVSAGALAGGLWASGLSATELAEELLRLRRVDFWDPGLPLGGLLKGGKFAAKLRSLLDARGVIRVEDCRLPFAAVVYDVVSRRVRAVDRGPLGPAIQASCTVPLMFRPLRHEGRLLLDGGVADRLGLCALQPGERALHHALRSRSPWRGLTPGVPKDMSVGPARRMLVIDDLPRVTPFRLDAGPAALKRAHAAMTGWLARS